MIDVQIAEPYHSVLTLGEWNPKKMSSFTHSAPMTLGSQRVLFFLLKIDFGLNIFVRFRSRLERGPLYSNNIQ